MVDTSEALAPDYPALPLRASHVAQRLVGGELVLYDGKRQRVHVLNSTAAFIWAECDGKHGQADIVAALAERYPEHGDELEGDVARVLGVFRAEGLLKT